MAEPAAGLIRWARGRINVLDRAAGAAHLRVLCDCECYAVVKKEYGRLLPGSTATQSRRSVGAPPHRRRARASPASADERGRARAKRTIVHRTLKAVSYVVIGLMATGIAYAATIAVTYWTGISV